MNSDKAPGSAGTGTSSGSKRGSSGAPGTTSSGSGAAGASGATSGRSIEELAYQEGRKRAEIERKGGSSSGTGSGAALGAGAGAGAGAAVSSPSSKSYRSGQSYDDADTVLSSPKGRVVRHPPKIHRQPVDKDVGGDFANQKLPIDDSLVNTGHFGNDAGTGAGAGAGAAGASGVNTTGTTTGTGTGTGTGAGSRGTGAEAGTGTKSDSTKTVGAATAGAVAGAAGTAAYVGSRGQENNGNHGVIENAHPSYSDDANKKEGTGVFFDPRDTQGGIYGNNNGGEMSEATKAELNKQRNLKTHPSAYYEEQKQKDQQKSVIDDIKNSAYNEGQAQGSRDAKAEQYQKDQAAGESGQESPSKHNDPESEHAKNRSAWNRDGVTTAAAEAKGQSGTNTSNSLYSERGLGTAAAGAAAGGAGGAALASHSNKNATADDAYGSRTGPAEGANKTYSTNTSAVGAANANTDLSDSDYDYDRQIKELDRRIASTQKEIDQVNSSGSGVYGASAGTPSKSAGTSASGTTGSKQTGPTTTAATSGTAGHTATNEQDDSSNKGIFAGTGIAAAITGAAGYVGLGKHNEKSTVDDAYGQGVKTASADTGAYKSILDEAYKQGIISGSYDAGKEYFRKESSQSKSVVGTSSTAPGTGAYKGTDVATTDVYLKDTSNTGASGETNSTNDGSSNKTGILAGSGIAAAIAGAVGYVGLGGKSHEKETVDEAYEEGLKAASSSPSAGKVHETKPEAFVKDPNAVSSTTRQAEPSSSSRGSNAAAGAAGGGVLGAAAAMASNTLGFDSDDNEENSGNRALTKDSDSDSKRNTYDPSSSTGDAEVNDDGSAKPGVLGGVTGAISAVGAVAAAKVYGGSSPSDIINEAYEAGREQGNIINEAYEAGRQQGSTGSSSSKAAYGSSASSKTSRSIDTPQLQDVDDEEEDDDEDEDVANTTTNSTRSGLFAGVFGGAAAAMGLSSLDRSDSNRSGIDPSKVDSQKDTVPREDLAKTNTDNSSGSGILGALGFSKGGETSSQGNLIDAADESRDVKSQPKHSGGARDLDSTNQEKSDNGDGVQNVPNLPSSGAGKPETNTADSSRKDTVPDKDLANEDVTDSKDSNKSGMGIGAAVGAAAGALGYSASKNATTHNDGSLIDPAARNYEDVAKAPPHGGDSKPDIKKSDEDVERKSDDEPKTSQNFSQTEADVAAYNKKHGITDDKRSLIEIAEGSSPEIKKMEAHHVASAVNETEGESAADSGDGVQPVPKSVLQHQNRFIATGGREGDFNENAGPGSHANVSEPDAKKKSLTSELSQSLESASDKSSNKGLMGTAAGALAGAAGAVGLSSASDKSKSNSKDVDSHSGYTQDKGDNRAQGPTTSTRDTTGVAGAGAGAGAAYGASQGSSSKKSGTTLSEKELYEYYEAGIIRGSYEAGQILGAEEASLATSKAEQHTGADTGAAGARGPTDSNSSDYGSAAAGAAGAGALGGAAGYGLSSSGKDVNADPSATAYGSESKAPLHDSYGQGVKEGSHSKGVEEGAYSKGVEEGAYSKGVEQSAYESGNIEGAKDASSGASAGNSAAVGAGVGAGTGLAAGTAYGATHGKSSKQSTLNSNELYAFYVAGIIQGSYEAGQIAGAEDTSLASGQGQKSQSDASHGHGLGAATAGAVGGGALGAGAAGLAASSKNKGAEESNLLVEVIGVKDEQAASKIAHQASKELSAQGVDLTHGKLVINTQTKEVYKTDDVNEKVGENTNSHTGRNALAGGAVGGAVGTGLGHSTDRQGGFSSSESQKNLESTDPNDHHDEHQKAKERLSKAANAGVLGNVQPSGAGNQTQHEREYDPSAGQSQSHHGLKAGAAGAGLGAAGAAAAAAAYGSHSHDSGGNRGYEGEITPSDRSAGNYSTGDQDTAGHTGQGISSREAMGSGATGQGSTTGHSGVDAANAKQSDGSDIVVTVQGTKDNAEATRIATETVEALKKQPSVLAAVKELRIDANTGIVTNEHGKRIDLTPSSGRTHHETQDTNSSQGIGAGSAAGLGAGAAGLGAAGAYGTHKHSDKTGYNQQLSYQDTQDSRSGAYGAHQAEATGHNDRDLQQGYQDSQDSRLGGSGTKQGYEDAYNQNRSRGIDSNASVGLGAAGAAGAAGAYGAHKYSHQDTQDSRLSNRSGDIYEDAYNEGYKQGSYRQTGSSGYNSANVGGSNYTSATRGNAPDQVAPTTASTQPQQTESSGLRMPGSFFQFTLFILIMFYCFSFSLLFCIIYLTKLSFNIFLRCSSQHIWSVICEYYMVTRCLLGHQRQ